MEPATGGVWPTGIPSLSSVQKARSDNHGDWGQISRVESMVGAGGQWVRAGLPREARTAARYSGN